MQKRNERGSSIGILKKIDERFPPLSISIESLVREGSDREFRRLIQSLVHFGEMIVRHRDIYGAYIGVSGPQYVMMTVIADLPDATTAQTAKIMSVSNQFVASEISKLVDMQIIKKTTNAADGRSMLLKLTAKGRNLLNELGPLRRESNDLMYRSLTGDRAKVLQEIMSALNADAEIALHQLNAPHLRDRKAPTATRAQKE